ncbi:MAG: hypothetical protein WCL70_03650 [Paludibacter sp.]
MTIHPKLKPVIFGFVAFLIFTSLSVILKLITNLKSSDDIYFNILSNKDLMIGLGVALLVTFSNERKKKLKN